MEIKETDEQVESVLVAHKSANQMFNERFKDLENRPIKSTNIFRVRARLRESNPDAYKPKLVSIGPYHRNNPQLHSMEKYKLIYLQRFLQRKGIDVEHCLRELEELKDEALKCYEDIRDTDGKFLQMMLLDGCFVVEYIREFCGLCPPGEELPIETGNIDYQVCSDLLLIENQLPLFILTKLDNMTKQGDQEPFILMVKKTLLHRLPRITPASLHGTEDSSDSPEVKHLLQVVHMSCYPSKTSTRKKDSFKDMSKDEDELTWIEMMPNATELSQSGVSFEKVGRIYTAHHQLVGNIEDNTSLFDIKFENGLMQIPCFQIHDHVESSLRNLIAYEQQSSGVKHTYFSDFVSFMDHLIDTDKDVNLLRQKGIIRSWVGEDKEVACLFNKITKGINIHMNDFYYKEECRKVVQHCQKPWNRIWANLRHNYFSSPWVGASTVAAIMLLLLTLAQTVLAFIKK